MRSGREAREGRKADRVPVGHGNKLEFTQNDPAYSYRMVNDVPGRIDMFLKAGYEFTYTGERSADKGAAEGGAPDTRVSVDAGKGVRAYRMRILKEFFDEDQAAKIERIKAAEDQMRNKDPDPAQGKYAGLTDQ